MQSPPSSWPEPVDDRGFQAEFQGDAGGCVIAGAAAADHEEITGFQAQEEEVAHEQYANRRELESGHSRRFA